MLSCGSHRGWIWDLLWTRWHHQGCGNGGQSLVEGVEQRWPSRLVPCQLCGDHIGRQRHTHKWREHTGAEWHRFGNKSVSTILYNVGLFSDNTCNLCTGRTMMNAFHTGLPQSDLWVHLTQNSAHQSWLCATIFMAQQRRMMSLRIKTKRSQKMDKRYCIYKHILCFYSVQKWKSVLN